MSMLSPIGSPALLLDNLPAIETRRAAPSLPEKANLSGRPPRPSWVEINLAQLRCNYQIINRNKSGGLQVLSVIKDEAYGHGALQVARVALESGVSFLGLSTVEEAM